MSVDGLVSGLNTTTLISQLMQIEAQPQTRLQSQLSSTQADATAYRALNTRFDALRSAAEKLTSDATWSSVKASSSSSAAVATAGTDAVPGSLTFSVDRLAASHAVVSDTTWSSTSAGFGLGSSLTVTDGGTGTKGSIPVGGTGTLADAIAAINASPYKLSATAVQVSQGTYKLQITSTSSGTAGVFGIGGTSDSFKTVSQGVDAKLTMGTGPGAYSVTSSTNTFSGLAGDTTVTVSAQAPSVTVTTTRDPDAVAAKITSLVSAANGLLDAIDSYTDPKSNSAVLKGDTTLRALADQVRDTLSTVLGDKGSAAQAGLQLSKDGSRFDFDSSVFTTKLAGSPSLVKDLFTATKVTAGPNGTLGDSDDLTSATGVAARLAALAKNASDSATGTLTLLAKSKDSAASDLQDRIADWDIRLAARKDTLTAQFTAMETALGTLKNQASWLTSQIASLPTWSTSSKS